MTESDDASVDGPDAEYRRLASEWSPQGPAEKIEHPLRAPKFMEQLEFLRGLMRSRDYGAWEQDLANVIGLVRETGMTLANGEWNPYWQSWNSPYADDSMAIELVDSIIASSRLASRTGGKVVIAPVSRRIAIAKAVVKFGLPGNSFEAACKRLQRLIEERDASAS